MEEIDLDNAMDDKDEDYLPSMDSTAIECDNYIQAFHALKSALQHLECPSCGAAYSAPRNSNIGRKKKPKSFFTLQLSVSRDGFASKVQIQCAVCDFAVDANPTDKKENYEGKSHFLKYGIKYKAVLLMQHLGISPEGLEQVLEFLGISPGTSNDKKWKDIQNSVGIAQEKICEVVIEDNIAEELRLSKEAAAKEL